jgi:hypothetical protein
MTIDSKLLSNQQRDRYETSLRRMTPTLLGLRFGNVEALAQRTPEAQQLASVARGAQEAWQRIHDTHWRSLTDTTATEGARLVRSATHARRQLQETARRYDTATKAAEARLTQLYSKIEDQLRPPQHAGLAAVATELRAYVRTLKPHEVMGAIRSDERIMDAVASAPAVLSGLAEDNWKAIRREYLDHAIPDVHNDYQDLMRAVESAFTAHAELTKETNALIDFETADALESHKVDA